MSLQLKKGKQSQFCAKKGPKQANYLVTIDVQPQRVCLTAVIEQKQSWENCSSNLPGKEKINNQKIEGKKLKREDSAKHEAL